MRSILFSIAALVLLIPTILFGQEFNAGFVQGIWYSSENIFADKPVRIYVALRNNTGHDLTGTVRFTDNGETIETTSVSALPGRLIEAWTDWKPAYGEHTVKATLTNVKLNPVGESPQTIEVTSALAEDILVIDYDTDDDGMGNADDLDDDNDQMSDRDEEDAGTDPLVYTEDSRSEEEETVPEDIEEENTDDTEVEPQNRDASHNAQPQGLERFIKNPTANDALTAVTKKVSGAKAALDAYRESRTKDAEADLEAPTGYSEESPAFQPLQKPEDNATITRTRTESENSGLFHSIAGGIFALLDGLYTLILWLLSAILKYPVLIQLMLLFGILVLVYKTAKKLGGRPGS